MPKFLRPNEEISFVQTRAPTQMWRYVKSLAMSHAFDGTATRLCTDHMLEYLMARRWEKDSWLRPKDLEIMSGATGFQQVNLPLSNMDIDGNFIAKAAYLRKLGVVDLFDGDKLAFRAALETGQFSKLVYLAADQLEVSGATLAYSFLYWLSMVRFAQSPKTALDLREIPAATEVRRDVTPRRRSRSN